MRKLKILSIMLVTVVILSVFTISASAKKLPLNVHYSWSSKGLKVMWSKVENATHYNIKLSRFTDTNKNLIIRKITSDSYTIGYNDFSSLNVNKLYYITVAAYKGTKKLGTSKVTTSDIEIVGHRGSMDKAPENTLAGLKKAKELGYDSVEADFFETESGSLLIFHDDYLKRCSAPDVNIRSLTSATRKNYPITTDAHLDGYKTQYIPSLAQYVKAASENKLRLYLHMKDKNNMSDNAIKKIVKTLKQYNMLKKTVVFSSDKNACKRLADSECISGYLRVPKSIDDAKQAVKYAKQVKADVVVMKYNEFLAKSVITLAHKHNIKIGYYRVSDKTTAAKVTNRGADFLITDKDFLHG